MLELTVANNDRSYHVKLNGFDELTPKAARAARFAVSGYTGNYTVSDGRKRYRVTGMGRGNVRRLRDEIRL